MYPYWDRSCHCHESQKRAPKTRAHSGSWHGARRANPACLEAPQRQRRQDALDAEGDLPTACRPRPHRAGIQCVLSLPHRCRSIERSVLPGDGYLTQCSLVQLARGFVRPESGQHVSDIPLAGSISSMHIVMDERSGQNVIIGGADDGSVAIWSLGCDLSFSVSEIQLMNLAASDYLHAGSCSQHPCQK